MRTLAILFMFTGMVLLTVGCTYSQPGYSANDASQQATMEMERALDPQSLPQPPMSQSSVRVQPGEPSAMQLTLYGELPGQSNEAVATSANLRQVTDTTIGEDFDIDIDPTGEWLVFASTRHSTRADLYLKRKDGNAITKLTSDPARDVMPTFSPDGKSIAFASDRSGNWDIYLRPIEGGRDVQITDSAAMELHPSFSPDGTELIFCALSPQSGQWQMVVVNIANPMNRRILDVGLFPKFSPAGDRIVFQRARMRGSRAFSIWIMDYKNGEATRPTEVAAASNAAIINPDWSPDGSRIAFSTVVNPSDDPSARPTVAELWAIDINGTGRVKLTNDKFVNLQPVWAPNGTIYFVSNRTGNDNIWSLRPDSSPVVSSQ